MESDVVVGAPGKHPMALQKLTAVVAPQRRWQTALKSDPVDYADDVSTAESAAGSIASDSAVKS